MDYNLKSGAKINHFFLKLRLILGFYHKQRNETEISGSWYYAHPAVRKYDICSFFLILKNLSKICTGFSQVQATRKEKFESYVSVTIGLGGILWKGSDIHWLIYKKSKMAPKGR